MKSNYSTLQAMTYIRAGKQSIFRVDKWKIQNYRRGGKNFIAHSEIEFTCIKRRRIQFDKAKNSIRTRDYPFRHCNTYVLDTFLKIHHKVRFKSECRAWGMSVV